MRWKHVRRRLRRPLVSAVIGPTVAGIARLPYSWLAPLARVCAAVARHSPGVRRLVCANLRVAFPEWSPAEVRDTYRKVCANLVQTFVEWVWFAYHPEQLLERVSIRPAARTVFERARGGHPLIMLTPHLGNWELAAQVACAFGVRVCAVFRPIQNPGVEKAVERLRTVNGLRLIPEHGAVRGMLGWLRAGNVVGILMDQNTPPHRGGLFVDFFGLPVAATRAPAALSRRLGVDVVCIVCTRGPRGLEVDARSLRQATGEYGDDTILTQDLLKLNEDLIRDYPKQYVWHYKRWLHIPESAPAEVRARYPDYARVYQTRERTRAAT